MGYTLTIGNAVPRMPSQSEIDDDEDRTPGWDVNGGESEDAPSFPGDERGSARSPSYSGWAEFCRATGLSSLFFGAQGFARRENIAERDTCLIHQHPGVTLLRALDLVEVRHAVALWKAKPWPTEERIPGFDPELNLARLLWLEFWIEWALKNCEHPAIGNT